MAKSSSSAIAAAHAARARAAITAISWLCQVAGSPEGLRAAVRAAQDALLNGRLHSLEGQFHDVPAERLAPVVAEFLVGNPGGGAGDGPVRPVSQSVTVGLAGLAGLQPANEPVVQVALLGQGAEHFEVGFGVLAG